MDHIIEEMRFCDDVKRGHAIFEAQELEARREELRLARRKDLLTVVGVCVLAVVGGAVILLAWAVV